MDFVIWLNLMKALTGFDASGEKLAWKYFEIGSKNRPGASRGIDLRPLKD